MNKRRVFNFITTLFSFSFIIWPIIFNYFQDTSSSLEVKEDISNLQLREPQSYLKIERLLKKKSKETKRYHKLKRKIEKIKGSKKDIKKEQLEKLEKELSISETKISSFDKKMSKLNPERKYVQVSYEIPGSPSYPGRIY